MEAPHASSLIPSQEFLPSFLNDAVCSGLQVFPRFKALLTNCFELKGRSETPYSLGGGHDYSSRRRFLEGSSTFLFDSQSCDASWSRLCRGKSLRVIEIQQIGHT